MKACDTDGYAKGNTVKLVLAIARPEYSVKSFSLSKWDLVVHTWKVDSAEHPVVQWCSSDHLYAEGGKHPAV